MQLILCVWKNFLFLISNLYILLFAGESLLVAAGLVIYFGDMVACTAAKVGFPIFNFPNVLHDECLSSFLADKAMLSNK